MMTKEMKLPSSVEDVILKNVMDLPKLLVNEVNFHDEYKDQMSIEQL